MNRKLGGKLLAIAILAVVPSYLVERITDYYFLSSDPLFFLWSGDRAPLFILSILVGAIVAGIVVESLGQAIVAYSSGIAILLALLYIFCQSRVCYSTGMDGLEPLRVAYFFGCLGIIGASAGNRARTTSRPQEGRGALIRDLILPAATMTAISYYPIMFTFAGTRLLAPLDPVPLLILVALISLVTAAKTSKARGRTLGVAVPALANVLLLLMASGIAREYFAEILPIAVSVVAVAVASAVPGAVLSPSSSNKDGPSIPRRVVQSDGLIWAAVIFVLILMVVFVPDATANVIPRNDVGQGSTASGGPIFGPLVYAGGLLPGGFTRPTGVASTVSFAGTNASSIQADNFLAAGIGTHSPHCCVDGIDFGYRFDVFLYHDGSEKLVAAAWEICDWNMACGGHSWQDLMFFTSGDARFQLQSNVRLVLEWQNRTVVWSYSIDLGPIQRFATFDPPAQENPYFHVGTLGNLPSSPEPPRVLYPQGLLNLISSPEASGFYFYQYGVTSHYPIGHGGWQATFLCPSYLLKGAAWTCLPHSDSIQGDQSYWKVFWRWGDPYSNVAVGPCNGGSTSSCARFRYDPASTLPNFETLW
jgi:hypothetical protein